MDNVKDNTGKSLGVQNYCPICQKTDLKDKFKVNDYTITKCQDCTALFVREKLNDEYLKSIYQEQEGNCFYDDENKDCINYYNNKIKNEIEKVKTERGRILDIGCSSGLFLELMTGWERHGIEISREYGEIARSKIGENVFVGPFEKYNIKENYFDVVTLFDVFDHFVDPVENIKRCYALMKPGGLLIIKVHNISCLFAKITGSKFYAIVPPTHLLYFNKKSLKDILSNAGFKLYGAKFIGHIMRLETVFFRLARGNTKSLFYSLYKLFDRSIFKNIKIHKNLHDIITVFALKS